MRIVLLLMTLGLVGCYRIRIDERFWIRPQPGPAADSTLAAQVGLRGYTVAPLRISLAADRHMTGLAATRPDATVTVLFWGGDSFRVADDGAATLRALTEAAPVNVLLVDYPGTGSSSGPATLASIKASTLAAFDSLLAHPTVATTGLVVHGHSFGSFIASYIADARPVRGLVLQSSATNPDEWIEQFFRPSRLKWWARPAYPFIRVSIDSTIAREDNRARVARYRGPLLVVVGADDEKTAPAMSRALVRAAAAPDSLKRLAVLPGSGHDDVLDNPGFGEAYRGFLRLLRRD